MQTIKSDDSYEGPKLVNGVYECKRLVEALQRTEIEHLKLLEKVQGNAPKVIQKEPMIHIGQNKRRKKMVPVSQVHLYRHEIE